jgi:ATP-dependent Clp protease ATP-binding subunit ClpB
MFHPLTRQDLMKIVNIQFEIIKHRLDENGIRVEISEKALERLAEMGYDPQFGARPLKRVIQREILNQLSKEILSGNVHKDSVVAIDVNSEGEIEFMNLDNVEIE